MPRRRDAAPVRLPQPGDLWAGKTAETRGRLIRIEEAGDDGRVRYTVIVAVAVQRSRPPRLEGSMSALSLRGNYELASEA